jgi:hypothetical protein
VKYFYLSAILATGILSGDQPSGTLAFDDRTNITGSISSFDSKQKTIELSSPALKGKVNLNTKRLIELSLDGESTSPESDHYAIATINHHFNSKRQDTIRGRLVNLNDESITLDTWYAGELTLKRSMVTALDVYPQSPSFYDGPNGLDGWVSSDGDIDESWSYADRSLISKSRDGIAREVQLPDRSMISCQVEWKSSAYFHIMFLSSNSDTNHLRKGYSLNVRRSYVQLYRTGPDNTRSDLINKTTTNLRNREKATIRIYLDRRKEGTSAVFLENELLGTWTDLDDTKGFGDWLHFVPQNSQPIKVSQISITQWDGTLPVAEDEKNKSATEDLFQDMEGQTILLANGDSIRGNIDKIEKGKLYLKTSLGDIDLPVRRMSSVSLGDLETKAEPRMRSGDVRAWFREGGFITMDLLSFDGKSLHGSSQVFDKAIFDASAFSKIEFNVWDPDLDRFGSNFEW